MQIISLLRHFCESQVESVTRGGEQGPLLLTWFNFNPGIDK